MKPCTPVHINFARRSLAGTLAGTPLWQLALGLLGLTLLVLSALSAAAIASRTQQLDEQLQRSAKKMAGTRGPASRPNAMPPARALAINAAIQQLNLPWSDVFDAIEAATPAGIALLSVEPDAKKQVLKGEAEALGSDDMIAYIERLKRQPLFVDVALTRHEVSEQDSYKPLRFQFEARWQTGSP